MLIEKWLTLVSITGREEIYAVNDTEQQAKAALLTWKGDQFPRMNYLYLRQVWVAPTWADRLRPTL